MQNVVEKENTRRVPIWEAITIVLQKYGNGMAMRISDVGRIAIKEGLIHLESKTPLASVWAILSMENKRGLSKKKKPRLFSGGGFVSLTEAALIVAGGTKSTQFIFVQESQKSMHLANVNLFRTILLTDFPRGFSFSSTSESLLASAAGKPFSAGIRNSLQELMFRREDDTWLLPEMVANDSNLTSLISCADAFLKEVGYFSVDALKKEFQPLLRNIPDNGTDFYQYFVRIIIPKLCCSVHISGGKAIQLCHESGRTETQVFEQIAAQISCVLQEAGDAVSVDFLRKRLPFLSTTNINAVIEKMIPFAITLKLDGFDYWKLLEFFYLPEDINKQVKEIVDQLETKNTAPSAVLIQSRLNHVYGGNFCENFAIQDESVFQQIISACYKGEDARIWKNRVFRRESDGDRSNVLDDFLQTTLGVFHESAFFDYAKRTRGLTQQGMLILTFLRAKCIRLNRDKWISIPLFSRSTDISPEALKFVGALLQERLGNQAFLPLGTLPGSFFECLPAFSLNGKPCQWNPYLLTSLCCHFIPSLRIVNDEPSPYIVTAMLIPTNADLTGDVVDYVLEAYQACGLDRKNAADIFESLKRQQVRTTKSIKLMNRIRSKCGVA